MSRRSSRRPAKKALSLPAGVRLGLASLVEGNESIVASMLSVDLQKDSSHDATIDKLVSSLTDCMALNNLSAEALLARFFDESVLKAYCESRLGVSGKGNSATLAARVAKAWAKPDFKPLPIDGDKKKAKKGSTKEEGGSKKKKSKRVVEKGDKSSGNAETKKPKRMWTAPIQKPSFTVSAPPGPLGLDIKQYSDNFIVEDISPSCPIPETQGNFPKVNAGDTISAIDGKLINSLNDDVLKEDYDKSREITIEGRIIGMNAAHQSKGTLLWMKEAGVPMFSILDYSDVAERYGQDFLEELSPPNKGKSGRQILAGALSSFK